MYGQTPNTLFYNPMNISEIVHKIDFFHLIQRSQIWCQKWVFPFKKSNLIQYVDETCFKRCTHIRKEDTILRQTVPLASVCDSLVIQLIWEL